MHAVIKNVKCEGARDDAIRNRGREDEVAESGERHLENEEEQGGHNEAEPIHRKIMVDAMHKEM